jgi:outer membrane cobalamin receptor
MARDRETSRRARSAVPALLALAWVAVANAAPPGFKGRAIRDVLQQLQDESLQFLYSNDLVKDSQLVGVEPGTRDRLGIAREVLAEHGLEIRSVNAGLYVVVRQHDGKRSRTFKGRVLDATSGAALSGARVELLPLAQVTWSDESGHFAFGELATGEDYRVRATIEDYARGEMRLRIEGSDAAPVDSTIRLHRVALDTVIVEASRYSLADDSPEGAQRLDAVALTNHPDIADDPIRALRGLPGVIQGGVSAASNLRGGVTDEVLILLDGFPLRQVYHLPGYQSPFSVLDENLIQGIDVFTGGFPARYGNRLAGVYDIATADAGQAPRTSLGLSFLNARARSAGEAADGNTRWRAAARVGTLRPVLQYLSVEGGQPSYSDLLLTATHRTGHVVFSGNFLWAADEYTLNDDDEHAEIESRTRYSWLRADFAPSENVTTSLWLGHSSIISARVGSVDKPEFAISDVIDHRDAGLWDARGNVNWQWSERSRLNAGFEWTQGRAHYSYDGSVSFSPALAELYGREEGFVRSLALSPEERRAAAFVSQRWKLGDRWMPEVGLRVQDSRIGAVHERTWDPRLGVRWEIGPRTGVRAHWGRFHQADEVHELAVADGVTGFSRAQRSEHLILGIEHRLTNGVQLRAEVFRKQQKHPRARFENLMSPLEVFAEVAPDRVRIEPDEAEMRGIELSIALERESWRGWSSVSVARAVDEFSTGEVPRSWDQRLAWSSGIDWHRGQWRVGGAATLRSGWPITPIGYTVDGDAVLGSRNADRLPAFATLDLRVEYRRPLAVGRLTVALEVSNLTNRLNQCCVDVEVDDIDTPDESIVAEKEFWPRLLPSLSIEWEL